jgi:ATP-dependent RNA helicase DDX35
MKIYDPKRGIESLMTVPISKASAIQRAGRAGRIRPGKAFRLYTESTYQSLPSTTVPEIQRSNLVHCILQMKAIGIDNIVRFDYLSPPPSDAAREALQVIPYIHLQ